MMLEVVKEKNPNFLYLYGGGAQGMFTSESQHILLQLRVGFAEEFGKSKTYEPRWCCNFRSLTKNTSN